MTALLQALPLPTVLTHGLGAPQQLWGLLPEVRAAIKNAVNAQPGACRGKQCLVTARSASRFRPWRPPRTLAPPEAAGP